MYEFDLYIKALSNEKNNIELTERGKKLALSFQNKIKDCEFFIKYKRADKVPREVLLDFSKHCCPCLTRQKENHDELKELIDNLINTYDSQSVNEEIKFIAKSLKQSILLVIECISNLSEMSIPLNEIIWRDITVITLFEYEQKTNKFKFNSNSLEEISEQWKLYQWHSLFIYAIECGLTGLLQHLYSNNKKDYLPNIFTQCEKELLKILNEKTFQTLNSNYNSIYDCINTIEKFDDNQFYKLLKQLLKEINNSEKISKIIYSFILSILSISYIHKDKKTNKFIGFYNDTAMIDGNELSIISALQDEICEISSNSLLEFLNFIFLEKWIIYRQLEVRKARNKEEAWLTLDQSNNQIEWEADFNPQEIRSSRLHILLGFLESLDIVYKNEKGWFLNFEAKKKLRL